MDIIKIIAVENLPLIKDGDNLAELISNAAEKQGTPLVENDIIVVTHVVVSKAEGNIIDLDKVIPSERAVRHNRQYDYCRKRFAVPSWRHAPLPSFPGAPRRRHPPRFR